MTFSKIAGGLLLLAALVPTTQAMPAALRALQRNRRAGFCDVVQQMFTCSQQQASACAGDCLVNEEGECSLSPAVALQSFNMQAMLAPLLTCFGAGMGGEEACNAAYAGGMCKWTTNDEGKPMCSAHPEKLVAAMGGDPVMNDMLTASITCKEHESQNRCSADTNCQYDGNSCGPNVKAFMSTCATSGGSDGGGSGAGDKCKGLTKMAELILPCAGKDKAACGAVDTCSYEEEDMECTPGAASAMQAVLQDKDVMAATLYIRDFGSGCDTKDAAACQADAKCKAGSQATTNTRTSYQNGTRITTTETTYEDSCEDNVKTMLDGAGCGGSVLDMHWRIVAAKNKDNERKANAAVETMTAATPKLVEAATATKKAADACTANCDELSRAAAEAAAAVARNAAAITGATAAAEQFKADAAAAETNAANSPASHLVSSAAAVFAAAAAATMAL